MYIVKTECKYGKIDQKKWVHSFLIIYYAYDLNKNNIKMNESMIENLLFSQLYRKSTSKKLGINKFSE
jgi:hypothetical protein